MDYKKRIRDLRQENDLTQEFVARNVLGISQTMYARYERGANEMPIRHLISLSKYYQVTTDFILALTDKRN
ncbi:MAG: helix-turn-helix domain-containing protein [Lachnospiraceae bacterium]|nr:helix-turn-helix domain-containing protein [Lachnospiraceae bacterium]